MAAKKTTKKTAKKTATKSKSKKAGKTAAAPKAVKEKRVKDGLPRPGSKKAELLRLLSRASGATMAEMLESTGWKVVSTRMKECAKAAGKKLRTEKAEGNATRWYID